MVVRVKICGITNLEDAFLAVNLGADALGFIFAKSPRRIEPEKAREIIDNLPPLVSKVGVFGDENGEKVKEAAAFCGLDTLQFHGDESPSYCQNFRSLFKVIKSFRIRNLKSLKPLSLYSVDAILLDTYSKEAMGGTGKTFNWGIAKEAQGFGRPLILSGGLNPSNVTRAINLVEPYAVDVSSGVELSPGRKDPEKLRAFFEAVKQIDRS